MSRLRKPVPNAFGFPSGATEHVDQGESRARWHAPNHKAWGKPVRAINADGVRRPDLMPTPGATPEPTEGERP